MQLAIKLMDWDARKKSGDCERFHWLAFEWQHLKPRPGPDSVRSHEYTLWILVGWGGVMIELICAP
jgi:hypothetical protein